MTEYKLHKVLLHIAKKSYPSNPIEQFYVKYSIKEYKKEEYYSFKDRTLTLYNLDRPVIEILLSSIHMLAHHIAYGTSKDASHDEYFYIVYHKLVTSAILIGYIKENELSKCNYKDIELIKKKAGPIYAKYRADLDINKDNCTITVENGYKIKSLLLQKNYHYSTRERIWEKDMKKKQAENDEKEFLKIDPYAIIKIGKIVDLSFDACYLLILTGNTYPVKKVLMNYGYRYKDRHWQKVVHASKKKQEELFIKTLGEDINYKIE